MCIARTCSVCSSIKDLFVVIARVVRIYIAFTPFISLYFAGSLLFFIVALFLVQIVCASTKAHTGIIHVVVAVAFIASSYIRMRSMKLGSAFFVVVILHFFLYFVVFFLNSVDERAPSLT